MFNTLLDQVNLQIKNNSGRSIKLANEIEEHHNKDSKYIIKNWLWELPQYRKWRITRLDGGKRLQVFNTVIYPQFESESPILGVDILWFGSSKKILAVLDYQPLIQTKEYLNEYCSILGKIKHEFPLFGNTGMKNLYDSKKFFSPWVIIYRGEANNSDNDLDKIFSIFLKKYLDLNNLKVKNKFLNNLQIKEKHIEYDKYSADKDPADKLFINFFGVDWTEKFIKNFLFTLS